MTRGRRHQGAAIPSGVQRLTSVPRNHAPGRADAPRPPGADASMSPDGLLLLAAYGTACYVLGLVTGARLIPWLVDRGWFPPADPC
jgi:hypothetical protein